MFASFTPSLIGQEDPLMVSGPPFMNMNKMNIRQAKVANKINRRYIGANKSVLSPWILAKSNYRIPRKT